MVHSPRTKASEVLADGALSQISGLSSAAKGLPFLINSGNVNMETALAGGQGHWVAPCDIRIVGANLVVTEQLGTGAGTIAAGIIPASGTADPDAIVDDYSVATSVTAGTAVDLTANAAVTGAAQYGAILPKGTVIYFTSDGGATTTGRACLVLIAVPA